MKFIRLLFALFICTAAFVAIESCEKDAEVKPDPTEDHEGWGTGDVQDAPTGFLSLDEVESNLRSAGYSEEDIQLALSESQGSEAFVEDGLTYINQAHKELVKTNKRSATHNLQFNPISLSGVPTHNHTMYQLSLRTGGTYYHIGWVQNAQHNMGLPLPGIYICNNYGNLRVKTYVSPAEEDYQGEDCGEFTLKYTKSGSSMDTDVNVAPSLSDTRYRFRNGTQNSPSEGTIMLGDCNGNYDDSCQN